MARRETKTIPVWDPLVRLFHWSLLIAFGICYFTQEEEYELHLTAGYFVLGLVLTRIVWGFVGSRHARFGDFLYPPRRVFAHLRGFVHGQLERYIGHTPAGGMMTVFLLLDMLVITLSGIALDGAENRSGPLAETSVFTLQEPIRRVHETGTDIALLLIAIHVAAVLITSRMLKENLPRAMLTGRKRP